MSRICTRAATDDVEGKGVGPKGAIADWAEKNKEILAKTGVSVRNDNGVAVLIDTKTGKHVAKFVPKKDEPYGEKEPHGPSKARLFQRHYYVLKMDKFEIETADDWKEAEQVLSAIMKYDGGKV
ncbi:MAG: hypothetical protein NC218_02485 [Acetobacter sp.]|nr:hypothetical protein [Acetobacter sp.]